MPTSTEGNPAGSSPSSGNGSPVSVPSKTHSLEEKQGKLDLADQSRLMLDNQRILDMTAQSSRELRSLHQRVREAEMAKLTNPAPPAGKSEDDMRVLIDSPTTINMPTANGMGTLAKLGLAAAVALGTGGIGLGAIALLKPSTQPAQQKAGGYILKLAPDASKEP